MAVHRSEVRPARWVRATVAVAHVIRAIRLATEADDGGMIQVLGHIGDEEGLRGIGHGGEFGCFRTGHQRWKT